MDCSILNHVSGKQASFIAEWKMGRWPTLYQLNHERTTRRWRNIQLPRSIRARNPEPEDKLYPVEVVESDAMSRRGKSTILGTELNTKSGRQQN